MMQTASDQRADVGILCIDGYQQTSFTEEFDEASAAVCEIFKKKIARLQQKMDRIPSNEEYCSSKEAYYDTCAMMGSCGVCCVLSTIAPITLHFTPLAWIPAGVLTLLSITRQPEYMG